MKQVYIRIVEKIGEGKRLLSSLVIDPSLIPRTGDYMQVVTEKNDPPILVKCITWYYRNDSLRGGQEADHVEI